MSNDPNHPNAGLSSNNPPSQSNPDELSHILEQVDSQLSALRKMRDERDQRMLDIAQRETELAAAAEQINARQRELESRQQCMEELERELSTKGEQVQQKDAQLNELRETLSAERQSLKQAAASLAAERERVEALAQQLDERERAAEQQVTEFKHAAEESAANAQSAREAAGVAQQAVEKLRHDMAGAADAFEKSQRELQAALEQERRSATERLNQIEQDAQARYRAAEQAHNEHATRLQQEIDAARREAESFREQITQLDDRVRTLTEQAARAQELEKKVTQREQQLAQLVQAVSEYEAEIDRLGANSTKDAAAVDERLRQRDERIKLLESQIEKAGAQSQTADTNSAQQLQALTQETDRLRAEIASRDQRIAELTNGASDGASQADALRQEVLKRDAALEELESHLAESAAKIEELEHSLKDQTPVGAKKEMDKLRHEIARREEAIRTLHARLEKASANPGGAGNALGTKELEAIERRRKRLAGYRDALREKTAKLSKAKKTIELRYTQLQKATEEVKQLDEMRRAIALERAGLERTERRVRKAQARSSAWMLLACMAITLGTLGLGSWWGVGQFVKPTYLAHTTIGVDPSVELDADLALAWQNFHESLLTDPKLLALAAQRMDRRGVETLANAGDLDWFLKENLDMTSSGPGEMTLTLKDQGGARTERILSTLATAIVAISADTRDLRADQTAASIIEPVSVDPTPIEDPRLAVFGAVFGGAAALTLFAGVIFSRKLASSRNEFEESMAQPEVVFDTPAGTARVGASTTDDSVPPHGTITGGPPIRRPV